MPWWLRFAQLSLSPVAFGSGRRGEEFQTSKVTDRQQPHGVALHVRVIAPSGAPPESALPRFAPQVQQVFGLRTSLANGKGNRLNAGSAVGVGSMARPGLHGVAGGANVDELLL